MIDTNDYSDKRLLIMYKEGNHLAFNIFYDRHKNILWKQAKKRTSHPSDAEEVYQTFFEKFITKIITIDSFIDDLFKNSDTAVPYVLTMMRNTSIDFYRKKNKIKQQEVTLTTNDKECDGISQDLEPPDQMSKNNIKSQLFYEDITHLIWQSSNEIEYVLKNKKCSELERKRLDKKSVLEKKEATLLENILMLFYVSQLSCTETSLQLGIDRKTLLAKRKKIESIVTSYYEQ